MKKYFIIILLVPTLMFSQNAKEIAKMCMASTVSLVMEDNFKQPLSLGSGFIVDNGKVITNLHVIENAKYGYVTINGESKKHNIEGYLAIDKTNDLALLSVPTLIGNSIEINDNNPEIGEKIYAIGNPKGLSGTISEGIISGIRTFDNEELIQITAPISPGSSGGPVINNNGQLIGVSVGTLDAGQNLNFAIPTKYVTKLIQQTKTQLTQLNIKSVPKKDSESNLGKGIKEGLEIINIEWNAIDYSIPAEYRSKERELEGFSIKNNLPYEITKVTLLFILRNAQGQPIDAFEYSPYISYGDYIKPFLAKYIEAGFGSSIGRERVSKRKSGEKLEIRILDFSIKE
ncbi:S1C family serine protease [Aequorivita todarodis]|uniref:S1C family serine protease n=1 Tax=Aequorivita todarodis TaxID=2036821 RepID=UPI0023502CB5|nr:S1C family serine protease [Aequorivita todarodis]MDC8001712.1 S1C family serine protease [Aequorivita todarodis]